MNKVKVAKQLCNKKEYLPGVGGWATEEKKRKIKKKKHDTENQRSLTEHFFFS